MMKNSKLYTTLIASLACFAYLNACELPPKTMPEVPAASSQSEQDASIVNTLKSLLEGNALCPFAQQINTMNAEELRALFEGDNLDKTIAQHIANGRVAAADATAPFACAACKAQDAKLNCPCKTALYCSKECQKKAWVCHKAACLLARGKFELVAFKAGDVIEILDNRTYVVKRVDQPGEFKITAPGKYQIPEGTWNIGRIP